MFIYAMNGVTKARAAHSKLQGGTACICVRNELHNRSECRKNNAGILKSSRGLKFLEMAPAQLSGDFPEQRPRLPDHERSARPAKE